MMVYQKAFWMSFIKTDEDGVYKELARKSELGETARKEIVAESLELAEGKPFFLAIVGLATEEEVYRD